MHNIRLTNILLFMLVAFPVQASIPSFDREAFEERKRWFSTQQASEASPKTTSFVVDGVIDVPMGPWINTSTYAGTGMGFFLAAEESSKTINLMQMTLRLGYMQRFRQTYREASIQIRHIPVLAGFKLGLLSPKFYFSGEMGLSMNFFDGIEAAVGAYGGDEVNKMHSLIGWAAALGLGYQLEALDLRAGIFLPDMPLLGSSENKKSIMFRLGHKFHTF
jgi:hypothetical protein